MRISAKCDYACRAILDLAIHYQPEKPVKINAISKRQNIPEHYLIQILIQLKNLKMVSSMRGKDGGYVLAKSPEQISLGKLIREINGPLLPKAHNEKSSDVFAPIWEEVETAIARVLDRISFKEIQNKVRDTNNVPLFDI